MFHILYNIYFFHFLSDIYTTIIVFVIIISPVHNCFIICFYFTFNQNFKHLPIIYDKTYINFSTNFFLLLTSQSYPIY